MKKFGREERVMDEATKLTDKELQAVLDARIRSSAGWKLRDSDLVASELGLTSDDKELNKISQQIYDDIMSSMGYEINDNIVAAVRAAKFSVKYVGKVISSALKAGTLQREAQIMSELSTALTEAMKKKPKGQHIGFAKLKAKLAAKGARTPGALSAWIGAKKYGGAKKVKKGKLPKSAWKAYAKLNKK